MKKPNGTDSRDHTGDLLLPYLEDRLSNEDRAMVQRRLNTCQEYSDELQSLEQLMAKLKANKDIFCPKPSKLFDFVETGEDPEGKLARHIERCPLCQEDVALYRARCESTVLPEKVRSLYRRRFPQRSRKRPQTGETLFTALTEWWSSFFRVPAFAMATLATAVLVAVVIYPRGDIGPFIGLSSVAWKQPVQEFVPKSWQAPVKRPRVAVVLVFRGFKKPWPQVKIDSLYKILNPPEQECEQFEFLSPANIQAALKGKIETRDESQIQSQIARTIDAETVILIEVISREPGLQIDGRAVDAGTGKTVDRKQSEAVSEPQLSSKLQEVLSAILGSRLSIR